MTSEAPAAEAQPNSEVFLPSTVVALVGYHAMDCSGLPSLDLKDMTFVTTLQDVRDLCQWTVDAQSAAYESYG